MWRHIPLGGIFKGIQDRVITLGSWIPVSTSEGMYQFSAEVLAIGTGTDTALYRNSHDYDRIPDSIKVTASTILSDSR